MLQPVFSRQFEKDIARAKRRGKNLEKLKILVNTLLSGEVLDSIHRDHRLIGNFVGRRECHIESDWLLIYKIDPPYVIFERMGSHSDLFKK